MEGPLVKRPKLLDEALSEQGDWLCWYKNFESVQCNLLTGCLCQMGEIKLQKPIFSSLIEPEVIRRSSPEFPSNYTLQFISTVQLLCELAVSQRGIGFICAKVFQITSSVSADEGVWETLLQLLGSSDIYISYTSTKCLSSLLIWTRVPTVSQVFDELLDSVVTGDSNPLQITHSLEVIRGIIDHSDEDEHPLQLLGSGLHGKCNAKPQCTKIEIEDESELEVDVKSICIKALESWWTRLLTKFKNLMSNYEEAYEHSISTFLSLWQSIVSIKSSLNVVDTKQFYIQVDSFVSHLNSALPPTLWKKLMDVFNEILCYGTTLSLQDSLPEEPCDLAHLILRCVKSRHFLQGVPYSKSFYSFGGTSWMKAADTEWESERASQGGSDQKLPRITKLGNKSFALAPSSVALNSNASSSSSAFKAQVRERPSSSETLKTNPKTQFTTKHVTTIDIGPTTLEVQEEPEEMERGDMPLLQKVVLIILKCVAVTVRETKDEVDSSDEEEEDSVDRGGQSSPTGSDFNDMVIIERSVRMVFEQLDSYVKSLVPYHPATPLCEWIPKLFADQDDVLVEGMLCSLDSFTSFIGRIDITTDFYQQFNPVTTFMTFVDTISEDKAVLIDLLIGNETCFLLYLLRFLKYVTRNWEKFMTTCGSDVGKIMGLFIRLKITLVNSPHFPYNIDPVIRLLEKCENSYESSNQSLSS